MFRAAGGEPRHRRAAAHRGARPRGEPFPGRVRADRLRPQARRGGGAPAARRGRGAGCRRWGDQGARGPRCRLTCRPLLPRNCAVVARDPLWGQRRPGRARSAAISLCSSSPATSVAMGSDKGPTVGDDFVYSKGLTAAGKRRRRRGRGGRTRPESARRPPLARGRRARPAALATPPAAFCARLCVGWRGRGGAPRPARAAAAARPGAALAPPFPPLAPRSHPQRPPPCSSNMAATSWKRRSSPSKWRGEGKSEGGRRRGPAVAARGLPLTLPPSLHLQAPCVPQAGARRGGWRSEAAPAAVGGSW